jgi:hypothetical protein
MKEGGSLTLTGMFIKEGLVLTGLRSPASPYFKGEPGF